MTKYKARKVELDGYKFDSIAEANHYKYIILPMLQAGKIQNLVVHPKFPCVVNGKKICTYIADFEFEFQMAMMNFHLNKNITSLFMMPDEKFIHLNSSVVKDVSKNGGDVSAFVPPCVQKALFTKFSK